MSHAPLHIRSPCHEVWDGMTPVAQGRHCASCNHTVIDVASMPVTEDRRMLDEVASTLHHDPSQRTCVRAHVAPSGRLVAGRRKLLTHALGAMLASSMAGCGGDGPEMVNTQQQQPVLRPHAQEAPALTGTPRVTPPPPHQAEVTMGDVCVPIRMGKIAPPAPAATSERVAP